MILEDGTGSGVSAKVDINNRLLTYAISTDEIQYKTMNGDGYTVGTSETIYLSGSTQSGVLFLKNNDNMDLVFTKIFILISGTTDATEVSIIRNPDNIVPSIGLTGGGLTNSNFGEFNTPNITAINGSDSAIFENGSPWLYYYPTTPFFSSNDTFVLTKGNSVGVYVTPPSSNISGINVNIGFAFYTKAHINTQTL